MPKILDEQVIAVVCRCGAEAIDSLLRTAKQAGKPVKLTAATKSDLVSENLRRAVAEGHIAIEEVFEMIADWEEHQPQYHLLFLAENEVAARLRDIDTVGNRIWGNGWETRMDFPRVLDEPVGEQWADFRTLSDGWIMKLYRGGSRWILDESQSTTNDELKVRVWIRRYKREVWCARYYTTLGILDMRIPNLDNKDDLSQAQQGIWNAVGNLVTPAEVQVFGLQKAAAVIARDSTGLSNTVHVSYSRFPGSRGGNATYAAHGDQEPLHNNPEFITACQLFTVANEIVVHWLPTKSSNAIQKKTRTVIGSKGPNALLFSAESNRKCVEHVIDKIIQLQNASGS